MGTLWPTQRRSAACSLLSGVFLVTAVVLSRRISGDASVFSSELAACLTGLAASLIAVLAASLPDLISDHLDRPQRTLLISGCGLPGVMLGLAVMPAGSSTGVACLLGLFVSAVLTISAFDGSAGSHSGHRPVSVQTPTMSGKAAETIATISEQASETCRPGSPLKNDSDGSSDPTCATGFACVESPANRPPKSTGKADGTLFQQAAGDQSSSQPASLTIANASPGTLEKFAEDSEVPELPFELNESLPHPASNPDTTQWMSRSRIEGLDVAEGSFRVRFAAGQRLAPVHLPFSPPLADSPEFECEPADDSDLRFRTTAVHAYGVRIEVSRSGDCGEEATAEVAWMASAALSDSVAA
ncbi:MAG: hypothetical protein ISQ06_13990 [Planctomycetaceae bacterium]|jgi:hypothetical protein|nr:hypothetical protein [Planctomycetaceae bacterium]